MALNCRMFMKLFSYFKTAAIILVKLRTCQEANQRTLVVVHVQIIGCTKQCNHSRESRRFGFAINTITRILSLVSTDNGQQPILFQERTCRIVTTIVLWGLYGAVHECVRTWKNRSSHGHDYAERIHLFFHYRNLLMDRPTINHTSFHV